MDEDEKMDANEGSALEVVRAHRYSEEVLSWYKQPHIGTDKTHTFMLHCGNVFPFMVVKNK
jgi:hypothetical protein